MFGYFSVIQTIAFLGWIGQLQHPDCSTFSLWVLLLLLWELEAQAPAPGQSALESALGTTHLHKETAFFSHQQAVLHHSKWHLSRFDETNIHNLILISMWRLLQSMVATWWWLRAFLVQGLSFFKSVDFGLCISKLSLKQRMCRVSTGKTFCVFSIGDFLSVANVTAGISVNE